MRLAESSVFSCGSLVAPVAPRCRRTGPSSGWCLTTSKAADTYESLVGSDARCCHGEFGRGPTVQGDGDNIELLPKDL